MSEALRDARLISRYASARGLLPADSPLPAAIQQAEARLQAGALTAAEEQELNRAINGAAALIRPMTIEQLRAAHVPEGQPALLRLWWSVVGILIPTVIGLICAGLIFVIIPLTTNFNRISVFINELKPTDAYEFFANLTDARVLQSKLTAARDVPPKLVQKNVALKKKLKKKKAQPKKNAGAPPATEPTTGGETKALAQSEIDKLEADLKAKAKYLQEADSRISVNLASITRVIDTATGAPRWYALIIQSYGLDEAFHFLLYRALWFKELPPSFVLTSEGIIRGEIKDARYYCSQQKEQERSAPANPSNAPKDPAYWKALCDNLDYAQGIGLRVAAPGIIFAASEARQQAESLNILLGSAILPVLYGLLGASVFLLRRAWGEDTNAARARPLNVSAFLRLALGGIAGLAIGWFWVPSAKTAGDLTTLTTTPFALAFLAGFSIELLFSILDRILGAVNPNTPPQPQQPAPPAPPQPPPNAAANQQPPAPPPQGPPQQAPQGQAPQGQAPQGQVPQAGGLPPPQARPQPA